MSSAGGFVAGTIEDILVALAQGIRDAQERLNTLEPFDEYGRPKPQYYLPQLDFTLKINAIETTSSETAPAGQAQRQMSPTIQQRGQGMLAFTSPRLPAINFALASPAKTASSTTNEVYSTVSGRFVAVPPNDGMPQVSLAITAAQAPAGGRKRTITVTAAYAAGGPVSGATVEFNVDPVATAAFNELASAPDLDNTQIFQTGSVVTDDAGVAATVMDFAAVPASAAKLLIVANLGPVRTSLLITEAA